jgi:hypothetical protein
MHSSFVRVAKRVRNIDSACSFARPLVSVVPGVAEPDAGPPSDVSAFFDLHESNAASIAIAAICQLSFFIPRAFSTLACWMAASQIDNMTVLVTAMGMYTCPFAFRS